MNRVVDEDLVPAQLLKQQGSTRLFARLASAFASFYFDTESTLLAAARRDVVHELYERVRTLHKLNRELVSLKTLPQDFSWKVQRSNVEIDVYVYVVRCSVRAQAVDQARSLVTERTDVMGGMPCFANTRVPIEIVLAALDEGSSLEELREAYSFLTEAHIEAARTYAAVHPKRGRPRRKLDTDSGKKRHVSTVKFAKS